MSRRNRRYKRTDVSEEHTAYISGFESLERAVNFYHYTRCQNRKRGSAHSLRSENLKFRTPNFLFMLKNTPSINVFRFLPQTKVQH
jgi:hypothetical protein